MTASLQTHMLPAREQVESMLRGDSGLASVRSSRLYLVDLAGARRNQSSDTISRWGICARITLSLRGTQKAMLAVLSIEHGLQASAALAGHACAGQPAQCWAPWL